MKKSILMLAFTAIVGASFAFGGQEGAKKEGAKTEKACCKKGGKTCAKGEKSDAKVTETKVEKK